MLGRAVRKLKRLRLQRHKSAVLADDIRAALHEGALYLYVGAGWDKEYPYIVTREALEQLGSDIETLLRSVRLGEDGAYHWVDQ